MAESSILHLLAGKSETIERCIARAREEYFADPDTFLTNYTRQDAAVLNLLRACESCIDMGQVVIHHHRMGIPKSAKDVFAILEKSGYFEQNLTVALMNMVSYRNIAVHQYKQMDMAITIEIIERHLTDLLEFRRRILLKEGLSVI